MTGRRGVFAGVAAVLLAGVAPALADDSDTAARELNRAGLDAYARGEHEQALRSFEKAYALKPDGKVRLNMALACENLMRLDDAAAHYEAFLAASPTNAKAPQARKQLADLKARMKQWGKVVILVTPAADVITIGGRTFAGDSVSVWVAPGQYALTADKTGHVRHASVVRVEAGARVPIKVELQAAAPVAPVPPPERPAPSPAVASAAPPPPTPSAETEDDAVAPPMQERPAGLITYLALIAGGAGVGVAVATGLAGMLGCLVAPVSLAWPVIAVGGTLGAGALAWYASQKWLRWRTSLLLVLGAAAGPTLACAVPTQLALLAAWAGVTGFSSTTRSVLQGNISSLPSALASGGVCFAFCMGPAVATYVLAALVGPLGSAFVANEFGRTKARGDEGLHLDLVVPPDEGTTRKRSDDDG